MTDLTIGDLFDLVASEVPDAPERIEQIYKWHFDRSIELIRLVIGGMATLLAGFGVALAKGETVGSPALAGLVAVLALTTGTYAVYRLYQLRFIYQDFVASLRLYNAFKRQRSLVRLYVSRGRG